MTQRGAWWVEVQRNGTPYTPSKKPIQSDSKPGEYFAGPFHCADCAITCVSFGKTIQQAYEFHHGTDDQKFAVFLGGI